MLLAGYLNLVVPVYEYLQVGLFAAKLRYIFYFSAFAYGTLSSICKRTPVIAYYHHVKRVAGISAINAFQPYLFRHYTTRQLILVSLDSIVFFMEMLRVCILNISFIYSACKSCTSVFTRS